MASRLLLASLCLIVLLPSLVHAQFADTCSACAGATPNSGSNSPCYLPPGPGSAECVWCAPTTPQGQGYCDTLSGTDPCNSAYSKITSPALCPALPAPITGAVLLSGLGQPGALGSAGAAALVLLGLLLYSPLEGLQGEPPASTSVTPAALHVLFAAAVLLWTAAGLALATPTVPWLYLTGISDPNNPGAVAFTAFSLEFCSYVVRGGALDATALNCMATPLAYGGQGLLSMGDVSALPSAYNDIAANAFSIAVCVYFFALTTLVPAAALTSLGAYRVKNFLRHGVPPPALGLGRHSHALALALSCLGSLAVVAALGSAFTLAGPTSAAFFTSVSPPSAGLALRADGMPGPLFAAMAMAFSLAATALLASTLCCTGVTGLPGFAVALPAQLLESCSAAADAKGREGGSGADAPFLPAREHHSGSSGPLPTIHYGGSPAASAPKFMTPRA